jgi:hypothetical protein
VHVVQSHGRAPHYRVCDLESVPVRLGAGTSERTMRTITSLTILAVAIATPDSLAGVTEFTNKHQWLTASQQGYSLVTFTGFPNYTIISNQFLSQGVSFTNGTDFIVNDEEFPDGSGLESQTFGPMGTFRISFSAPQHYVALDFIGDLYFKLYSHNNLTYTSSVFVPVPSKFAGLVSTGEFDRIEIIDPSDSTVVIDNLYFGPPIPAPGVLVLPSICVVRPNRRRKQ